jgi:hypothetical protein
MKSGLLVVLDSVAAVGGIGMVVSLWAWYAASTVEAHVWALAAVAASAVLALSCAVLAKYLRQLDKNTADAAQIGSSGNNAN